MVAAVLKSRWLTAVDLFSNKNMDHNNVSVSTIERMFYEQGLKARAQQKILVISEKNIVLANAFFEKE